MSWQHLHQPVWLGRGNSLSPHMWEPSSNQPGWLEQMLFYSILFYSILFYSILFYSILFYSILFCSVLFCSVLFCSVLFCSVLFYSILFYSIPADNHDHIGWNRCNRKLIKSLSRMGMQWARPGPIARCVRVLEMAPARCRANRGRYRPLPRGFRAATGATAQQSLAPRPKHRTYHRKRPQRHTRAHRAGATARRRSSRGRGGGPQPAPSRARAPCLLLPFSAAPACSAARLAPKLPRAGQAEAAGPGKAARCLALRVLNAVRPRAG